MFQKKDFPDGFFVVFLPDNTTDEITLGSNLEPAPVFETITLKVISKDDTDWKSALLVPLFVYALAIVLAYLLYAGNHQLYIRYNMNRVLHLLID